MKLFLPRLPMVTRFWSRVAVVSASGAAMAVGEAREHSGYTWLKDLMAATWPGLACWQMGSSLLLAPSQSLRLIQRGLVRGSGGYQERKGCSGSLSQSGESSREPAPSHKSEAGLLCPGEHGSSRSPGASRQRHSSCHTSSLETPGEGHPVLELMALPSQ